MMCDVPGAPRPSLRPPPATAAPHYCQHGRSWWRRVARLGPVMGPLRRSLRRGTPARACPPPSPAQCARPSRGAAAMQFTAEHEMFRQSVRRFVQEEINPHADEWEEAGIFPAHELFKKMGELGFLGLTYPEEYGGLGLDFSYTVVFCEELGQADVAGV